MTAQTTIAKLRGALSERDEVVRKLSVLNKALREANPEMARLVDERDSLRKMVEIYEEEVAKLGTYSGVIKAAFDNPGVEFGFDGTRNDHRPTGIRVTDAGYAPIGARGADLIKQMFQPGRDVKKDRDARIEENAELLKLAHQDPGVLKARLRRMERERKGKQ